PARARGGGARRHATVGPGEAPLPEPGADPPDPRPLDRQVHRAPRRGARRPQARPGGMTMTTMATEATTTQVYRVFIKASPEAVWDAITKPEFTERYFHGVRIELRDGRRWSSLGDGRAWDEAILEEDPPRRLVHTWRAGYDPELAAQEPSRVTSAVEPREHGMTLLPSVHDRLEGAPRTASDVAGEGWMFVLSNLKTFLETGQPLT